MSLLTRSSFFRWIEKQNARIEEIVKKELIKTYSTRLTRAGRARDYVYRHLTSEYMRSLSREEGLGLHIGMRGFGRSRVLSGGLVRDFIICAQTDV